jgi:hypothetical protein
MPVKSAQTRHNLLSSYPTLEAQFAAVVILPGVMTDDHLGDETNSLLLWVVSCLTDDESTLNIT